MKRKGSRDPDLGASKASKKQVGFAMEPEKEQLLTEENSPPSTKKRTDDGSVISLNNRGGSEGLDDDSPKLPKRPQQQRLIKQGPSPYNDQTDMIATIKNADWKPAQN